MPTDAKLTNAAALDFEMVRLDFVHRIMERETKTNIIFLDACRNNPLSRNLARAMGTRSIEIGRGLAAVESGAGTLISFSTQPGNVALDGTGRNSPFAGALVRHLTSSSDDLGAILIGVRNDVMSETRDQQVPWEHSALRGRFFFNMSANPASSQPIDTGVLREAAETWSTIKDTRTVAVLEAFVRRYGQTEYADAARGRIDVLRKEEIALVDPAKQSSAPGPSLAGTQKFIVDLVNTCPRGYINYREGGKFKHIEHSQWYETKISFDTEGRIVFTIDLYRKEAYNHAQKRKIFRDEEYIYTSVAQLGHLDPNVRPDSRFKEAIAVRCTTGACISNQQEYKKKSKSSLDSKSTGASTSFFFCNEDTAQRAAKALSHAIALSGGKRAPF